MRYYDRKPRVHFAGAGYQEVAEELASNPELREIVQMLWDSLRQGQRTKRSKRFA